MPRRRSTPEEDSQAAGTPSQQTPMELNGNETAVTESQETSLESTQAVQTEARTQATFVLTEETLTLAFTNAMQNMMAQQAERQTEQTKAIAGLLTEPLSQLTKSVEIVEGRIKTAMDSNAQALAEHSERIGLAVINDQRNMTEATAQRLAQHTEQVGRSVAEDQRVNTDVATQRLAQHTEQVGRSVAEDQRVNTDAAAHRLAQHTEQVGKLVAEDQRNNAEGIANRLAEHNTNVGRTSAQEHRALTEAIGAAVQSAQAQSSQTIGQEWNKVNSEVRDQQNVRTESEPMVIEESTDPEILRKALGVARPPLTPINETALIAYVDLLTPYLRVSNGSTGQSIYTHCFKGWKSTTFKSLRRDQRIYLVEKAKTFPDAGTYTPKQGKRHTDYLARTARKLVSLDFESDSDKESVYDHVKHQPVNSGPGDPGGDSSDTSEDESNHSHKPKLTAAEESAAMGGPLHPSSVRMHDIAKKIRDGQRYSGKSYQDPYSMWRIMEAHCRYCNISTDRDKLLVMRTHFLEGRAFDKFMDAAPESVGTVQQALKWLDKTFLPPSIRHQNNKLFCQLSLQKIEQDRRNATAEEHIEILVKETEDLGKVLPFSTNEQALVEKVREVLSTHPSYRNAMDAAFSVKSLNELEGILRPIARRKENSPTAHYIERRYRTRDDEEQRYRTRDDEEHRYRKKDDVERRYRTRDDEERRYRTRDDEGKKKKKKYQAPGWGAKAPSYHVEEVDEIAKDEETEEEVPEEEIFQSTLAMETTRASFSLGACAGLGPFPGFLIDTGASTLSLIGDQILPFLQNLCTDELQFKECRKVLQGIHPNPVVSEKYVSFAFTFIRRDVLEIDLYVVPGTVPPLICGEDMRRLGITLHTVEGVAGYPGTEEFTKIVMQGNLPFLPINPASILPSCSLTIEQVEKIHRNAGHPSAEKLYNLIKTSGEASPDVRNAIDKISEACKTCALKNRPRRFLVSLPHQYEGEYNERVIIDLMYLEDGVVLHVIDQATRYSAAQFVKSQSGSDVWEAFVTAWTAVQAGPPTTLLVDNGSNLTSTEFAGNAAAAGIELSIAPTEAHHQIGTVERSHANLRQAFESISNDLPQSSRELRLSYAIRAINDSTDENGVSPTLQVYGVVPRTLSKKKGLDATYQARAKAIMKARDMVSQKRAKVSIQRLLRGQKTPTNDTKIDEALPGSPIIINREEGNKIYPLVSASPTRVEVKLPGGTTAEFPRTHARLMMIAVDATSPRTFRLARRKEVDGFIEMDIYRPVHRSSVKKGTRIYGLRWIDKVKPSGEERSRLVLQAFQDKKHLLLTAAPTISRLSVRLIGLFAVMEPKFRCRTRDVSQAFLHSKTRLIRDIYATPVPEMNLSQDQVIHIRRPVYGLPESPLHWYKEYSSFLHQLGMQSTKADPCLLFKRDKSLEGILGLQVDDTFCIGTPEFLETESRTGDEYPCRFFDLSTQSPVAEFNGVTFRLEGDKSVTMTQKLAKLNADWDSESYNDFVSRRASLAYVAHNTRPDILVYTAKLAQVTEPVFSREHAKLLDKAYSMYQTIRPLRFVPMNKNDVGLYACVDASFGSNIDGSSQIGYCLVAVEESTSRANLLHFRSVKAKRVARSALTAELLAMVEGHDIGATVKHTMEELCGRKIPLTLVLDARSLYHLAVSLSPTPTEKRLAIDIWAVRQAYEEHEIRDILLVTSESNPADSLTKVDGNKSLTTMMETNKLTLEKQAWVDREPPPDLRTLLANDPEALAARLKPLMKPKSLVAGECDRTQFF